MIFRSETRDSVKVKGHGRALTASATGTQERSEEERAVGDLSFLPVPRS